MADAVKRIGLQFYLKDTGEIAKALKKMALDNKIELNAELENNKDFEKKIRELADKLNADFKEGLNIDSLLAESLNGADVTTAISNIDNLINKIGILNRQLGSNSEQEKTIIGHFNNTQVEKLLKEASQIEKGNGEDKNKMIKNAIANIGKNVGEGTGQASDLESKLDEIHTDIKEIKQVTDDLANGKLNIALKEQADGLEKVGEKAKKATENLKELKEEQDKIASDAQNSQKKSAKNENTKTTTKTDKKGNSSVPVTMMTPISEDGVSSSTKELTEKEKMEQELAKIEEIEMLGTTQHVRTNASIINKDNKAIYEMIRAYTKLGGTLEELEKIAPRMASAWKYLKEEENKQALAEQQRAEALKKKEEEQIREKQRLKAVGDVDKIEKKLNKIKDPNKYVEEYKKLATEIAKAKEEYLKFYPLLQKDETTQNKGMSWESKYGKNLDLEKGKQFRLDEQANAQQIATAKNRLKELNAGLASVTKKNSDPKNYLQAYEAIENEVNELINKLKELGVETDKLFQQRGFTRLNKEGVYEDLRQKRIEKLEKDLKKPSEQLEKIQDPEKYTQAYEKLKQKISEIKQELLSLGYKDWDEKFGKNLDFEKGLEYRKKALIEEKKAEEQVRTSQEVTKGVKNQTGTETASQAMNNLEKESLEASKAVTEVNTSLDNVQQKASNVKNAMMDVGQATSMSLEGLDSNAKKLVITLNALVESFNKIKGVTLTGENGKTNLDNYFKALQVVKQNRQFFDNHEIKPNKMGKDLSYNSSEDKKLLEQEIIRRYNSYNKAKERIQNLGNLIPERKKIMENNINVSKQELQELIFSYINDFQGELKNLDLKKIGLKNKDETENEFLRQRFESMFQTINKQALGVKLIIEQNEAAFEKILRGSLKEELNGESNNQAIIEFQNLRHNIINYIQGFVRSIPDFFLKNGEEDDLKVQLDNLLPLIPNEQNLHVLQNFDVNVIYNKLKEYIEAILNRDYNKAKEILNDSEELNNFLEALTNSNNPLLANLPAKSKTKKTATIKKLPKINKEEEKKVEKEEKKKEEMPKKKETSKERKSIKKKTTEDKTEDKSRQKEKKEEEKSEQKKKQTPRKQTPRKKTTEEKPQPQPQPTQPKPKPQPKPTQPKPTQPTQPQPQPKPQPTQPTQHDKEENNIKKLIQAYELLTKTAREYNELENKASSGELKSASRRDRFDELKKQREEALKIIQDNKQNNAGYWQRQNVQEAETNYNERNAQVAQEQRESDIEKIVNAYGVLTEKARQYYALRDKERSGESMTDSEKDRLDKLNEEYEQAINLLTEYNQKQGELWKDSRVQEAENKYLDKNLTVDQERKDIENYNKEKANAKEVIETYKELYSVLSEYQQLMSKKQTNGFLDGEDLRRITELENRAERLNEKLLNKPKELWQRADVTQASNDFVGQVQRLPLNEDRDSLKQLQSDYDNLYKAEEKLHKLELDQMSSPTLNRGKAIADLKLKIDEYSASIDKNTQAIERNNNAASMSAANTLKTQYEQRTNQSNQNFNTALNTDRFQQIDGIINKINGLKATYSTDDFTNASPLIEQLDGQLTRLADLKAQLSQKPLDILDEQEIILFDTQLDDVLNKIKGIQRDSKNFKTADGTRLSERISDFLMKNHGLSEEAKQSLQEYLRILNSGVNTKGLKDIEQGFYNIRKAEIEAGNTGRTFLDVIQFRVRNLAASLMTYMSFWAIINQVKRGLTIFKDFDSALAEMQKVSNETIGTLKEFQQTSFDLADSIGTDALSLQQSVAEFMRLGQSLEEATDSAQAANILFNVSEFESAKDASTALIAMSQAYDELSNTEIIDVINKLGNDFPISTEGLATALQDGAASLTTAGNDFYEAAALVTAGMILCLKNMETYFYRTHLIALIT